MAFEEYDDFEQEELVKEWLMNNWFTMVAGVGLGIGGIWGFAEWKTTAETNKLEAANQFARIQEVIELSEYDDAVEMTTQYETDHGSNFYTIKSHMLLAQAYVKAEEIEKAVTQYESIIAAKPEKSIAEFVRLRLARLQVSLGQYDVAMSNLYLVKSLAYKTVVEEITGDVFIAKGEVDKAHDAYQLAVNEGEGYSGKNIIEMKLADSKSAR
ncbi:MAG: tetratricopeptide repeat protein [Proteobacteria bacterium]|nr:tetratricopeptide repeat protein [Pseudomonadota bacterium]